MKLVRTRFGHVCPIQFNTNDKSEQHHLKTTKLKIWKQSHWKSSAFTWHTISTNHTEKHNQCNIISGTEQVVLLFNATTYISQSNNIYISEQQHIYLRATTYISQSKRYENLVQHQWQIKATSFETYIVKTLKANSLEIQCNYITGQEQNT